MATNFIGVLLPNSPDYTVDTGFATELFDADGGQTIIVKPGASLTLLGALGPNTIRLAGNAADWQVYRDGSTLMAVGPSGGRVAIPANTTAQTVAFADTTLALRIETGSSGAAVMLGSQVLDTVAVPVGSIALPGSTLKAAWTLVVPGSAGLYSSDGTATGSFYLTDTGNMIGRKTIANAAQTGAVVAADNLYGTDGTKDGTVVAASGSINVQNYFYLGNKIVLNGGNYANSAVTDGTKAGTTVVASMPWDLIDPVTQTLWGGVATTPYGRELFRTVVGDAGAAQTTMVKDIQAGTASGVPIYYQPGMALLPSGKLVFTADDGTGPEPWVSDGTASGTYKLVDFAGSSSPWGSNPGAFINVGQKVAFVASVDGKGAELVTTDGSAEGTKVFDINPGPAGSQVSMLGVIDGVLYFTAQVGNYTTTSSIFSTDGNTVRELTTLGSSALLLGWGGGKAYLKASDADHGQELWVVNLADGVTKMVKDILPGTGSALADISYKGNTSMVGDRLAFSAFISPTEKAFFLSDGTAEGTWQLSTRTPLQTIVVGQNVYFLDSDGVHMANSSGQVSLLGAPVPLEYYVSTSPLQADRDQVYFVSANRALYTANGGSAVQLSDGGVTQFKVVGENGVYFTKAMVDNSLALWFSDGTAAGTRFVRTLPAGAFDLANAVGLHTPGVALPADSAAPVFSFAKVSGKTLTLAYTDDSTLDAAHAPASSAFHLGGTAATVSAVTVDAVARTVVLTLSEDVKSTDQVLLSYTRQGSAAIQDSFGNGAASLVDRPVSNLTPDNVPPRLVSAVADGTTLTLTYVDTGILDATHLPLPGAFKLGGTTVSVTSVALDATGKKLILALSKPVLDTDKLTLDYTDPTTGNDVLAVQDMNGNDAASVTGFAVQNNTATIHGKAPWTLLVATNAGVYASDGTAAGSKLVYTISGYNKLLVNQDNTAAVLSFSHTDDVTHTSSYMVVGFSGSGNPVVLADGVARPVDQIFGKYMLAYGGDKGLVTDGTLSGTNVVTGLTDGGWADAAHQNIWSVAWSQPYGYELSLTRVNASGAATNMVKDILPGSGSGFVSSSGALVLPNGKLVFVGADLTGGVEPWVSDGSEAGTLRLADLQPGGGNTSGPQLLAVFGTMAAMSAIAYDGTNSLGRELVVTDGTVAGTRILDVMPGESSSNPQLVGVRGSTLYFTANVVDGSVYGRALFSTDGTTFARLANVIDGVTLLGQAGTRTYFSMSDASHGAELWVRDGSGSLGMVKDLLPGTGSALSGNINPLVVGDKLVFQAYTSSTARSLFASDGTADGTIVLGNAPSNIQQAGNALVYAEGGKVYGVDMSAATPKAVQLTTGEMTYGPMQKDADQIFFSMNSGDLFASNGTVAGTVALSHSVAAFKVVAENALYFVEFVTNGGYSLSYSDGTAAGTYTIGAVDLDFLSRFQDGVVVRTVGVPLPQH